jgi:hypothetical protein
MLDSRARGNTPMASALFSFKRDKDKKISVLHVFFGKDDDDAQKTLEAHAEICPKFGPAYRGKETVEIPVEIDSLPEGDDEELQEWIDDLMDLEEDDEEEEDEEEDED